VPVDCAGVPYPTDVTNASGDLQVPAPRQVTRALRVLIVADDPSAASFAREALTTSSGRPTLAIAATLEQALRALAENEYDCVLADLDLPDSDGLEVVLRLGEHKVGSGTACGRKVGRATTATSAASAIRSSASGQSARLNRRTWSDARRASDSVLI
jgi:CheY-like chemotaxis protein